MRIRFKVWVIFPVIVGLLLFGATVGYIIQNEARIAHLEYENAEQEVVLTFHSRQIPYIVKYSKIVGVLTTVSEGRLSAFVIVEIGKTILIQCEIYSDIGLTPDIILAVMERESGFDPNAISKARAYGLMQVIRSTAELHLAILGYGNMFSKDLILDPIINVEIGIAEIVRLRKLFLTEGIDNWMVVLTAYFWGERNTWELLNSKKRARLPSLEYGSGILDLAKKYQGIIPK